MSSDNSHERKGTLKKKKYSECEHPRAVNAKKHGLDTVKQMNAQMQKTQVYFSRDSSLATLHGIYTGVLMHEDMYA